MISVKVLFKSGHEIATSINATFEEACEYYMNNLFNTGDHEFDRMETAKQVILL